MKDKREADGTYRVRAVQRAMDLLDALGEVREPQELTALSRRVGLHPSTTLRILVTLQTGRLVRQSRDGWLLGARVFELGNSFVRENSIWSRGQELVERLAGRSNETSSLGILEHGEVLYIAIAHGHGELGIQSSPGTRHPAHATALGKVLLASMPWTEAEALLGRDPLASLTPNTLTTMAALREELEKVGARGYAVDSEERAPGVTCIAAPIRDHSAGVVAAISVSGPTFRMQGETFDDLRSLVRAHADEASEQLGAKASFDTPPVAAIR
jgi:IclR family acetate operon transcriptional repressor